MSMLSVFLAFEIINIALEYTATGWWVRFPNWILSVVAVNLMTHPLLMIVIAHYGSQNSLVIPLELAIAVTEWLVLVFIHGRNNAYRLLLASFVMNATSYSTGLLL